MTFQQASKETGGLEAWRASDGGKGNGNGNGRYRREKGREEASKARWSCIMTEGVNQIEEDGEALLSKKGWKYTASHHIVSTVTSPGRLQPCSAPTSAPYSKPSSSSSE